MQVRFNVVRQSQTSGPRVQSYLLEVEPGNTILDCLNRIKWEQDGTLAFRKNCRNTICGSCSMRINGRSALACKENVGSELARLQQISEVSQGQISDSERLNILQNKGGQDAPPPADSKLPEITIAPMGNMPVVKDLVVDMTSFWNHLEDVEPYVSSNARHIPEREFLQSPEEREKLNQTGNCILCGACYSECNGREVNENFVGPHALAKAYRMIADSRDSKTEERLEKYNESTSGVWGCTRCFYCNVVCPMEVAPLDQISKIKEEILERKDEVSSQPVRHRKLLLELVKEGGWLNERKFAIKLFSYSFKASQELIKLGPLGMRMLMRGKIPFTFEPSEGTSEVRKLIESVQKLDQKSID